MFSERLIDGSRKKEPTKEEYFKQRRKDAATGEYKNGYIKDRAINGTKRKQWLEEKENYEQIYKINIYKKMDYLQKYHI